MSITTFPPTDPLTWKQADTDVHVATRNGEFAGFVEFDGSAHLVRDERGTDLGAFETLDDAQGALENSSASRAAWGRRAPLTLPRAFRRGLRRARA
ncbi:hypothetical protein KZC51_05540 [Microbacterium sp. SSW1-49]|uniref:Uncharacterized protein n=1 Tax=Microbacterium croceum TaxID=2851645 RepID=A0ABT0FC23_9MICO|nr:hypothetical protein [Microbacterium croceum]MCK2035598.1 hypothetical protein [Microbacterium croceum]